MVSITNERLKNQSSSSQNGDSIVHGQSAGGDLTGTYPNPTISISGYKKIITGINRQVWDDDAPLMNSDWTLGDSRKARRGWIVPFDGKITNLYFTKPGDTENTDTTAKVDRWNDGTQSWDTLLSVTHTNGTAGTQAVSDLSEATVSKGDVLAFELVGSSNPNISISFYYEAN